MKRSIGLRTQALSFTAGSVGPCGGDERPVRLVLGPGGDPLLEHLLLGGRELLVRLGGRHQLFGDRRRRCARSCSLSSGLPGTIALRLDGLLAPVEPQARPCGQRCPGPWQAKQFSARIGRMSRLYSSVALWPRGRPAASEPDRRPGPCGSEARSNEHSTQDDAQKGKDAGESLEHREPLDLPEKYLDSKFSIQNSEQPGHPPAREFCEYFEFYWQTIRHCRCVVGGPVGQIDNLMLTEGANRATGFRERERITDV